MLISQFCNSWAWQYINRHNSHISITMNKLRFYCFVWDIWLAGFWKCRDLLFQFCHLICLHCLDSPGFSKCIIMSGPWTWHYYYKYYIMSIFHFRHSLSSAIKTFFQEQSIGNLTPAANSGTGWFTVCWYKFIPKIIKSDLSPENMP